MRFATATALSFLAASAAAKNCFGSIQNDGNNSDDQYCCIGGHVTVSVCAGWPMCTGPTTVNPTEKPSCATKIPWTASNYDQLLSSASSRYLNADGSITATGAPAGQTSATGTAASTTSSTFGAQSTGAAPMHAATLFAPVAGGMTVYAALA